MAWVWLSLCSRRKPSGLYLRFKIVFQMPEHLPPAVPALDGQLDARKPCVLDGNDSLLASFRSDRNRNVRIIISAVQADELWFNLRTNGELHTNQPMHPAQYPLVKDEAAAPPSSSTSATALDVPRRSAPAAISSLAWARVLIPPAALIRMLPRR